MMDRGAAERACKDPNPIIDGRKANINLAYLGAKPRSPQTGVTHTHTLFLSYTDIQVSAADDTLCWLLL